MSRKPLILNHFLAIFAMVFWVAAPAAAADDNAALEAARDAIAAKFDMIDPENVYASPIEGWYTLRKGSVVAYVTTDGRYLLQGDLIDLDTQVNLTELSRNDARRDLVADLADERAILFAPEEAQYKVTVFTDVDCTYCRKLHDQINAYMDEGIAIRYVLYPRNGPASKTWKTSEAVWCAADRGEALTAAKQDRDFASEPCDSTIVNEHYALGRKIGLNGTPAIVFEDGTMVGGYLPPSQLRARLQENAQK
jgi:thiol:disulfide interchange protein DsbC